jgi:hypothetical protein
MLKRYANTIKLDSARQYGTSATISNIRLAMKNGELSYQSIVLTGFERLDTLAAINYGDGRLWWVLAAASDIGWGMQVPPGTLIKIPNINQITGLLG